MNIHLLAYQVFPDGGHFVSLFRLMGLFCVNTNIENIV